MSQSSPLDFPWLGPEDYFEFPVAQCPPEEGIVAVGGNLSPGMLISAYRQGVFPWFGEDDPPIWWCPDPRLVLFTDELHVSRSMSRMVARDEYTITYDTDFVSVIERCSSVTRAGQSGTWITSDMKRGYQELHELGYAHSVETRAGAELVGGLYGVAIGRMFFGESMFSIRPNASKLALIKLVGLLSRHGFDLIDSQQETPHMQSMGARSIPRETFLELVRNRIDLPGMPACWTGL